MSRGVTILGSTGTIGLNTLDVIERQPERFHVVALTANRNIERLLDQCRQWQPSYAVVAEEPLAETFAKSVHQEGHETTVLTGVAGLREVCELAEVDLVMAGIVGAAGLPPTLAAAEAGKQVLLANKEALVMSGALFMDAVKQHGAVLLPIDSEHNAVFQCMPENYFNGLDKVGVTRILLTASGGPFRNSSREELEAVTPEQACAHPNWVMGRKISVDSASMMNKGLEIVEACWLFNTDVDHIEVVIHPQSIVHSMVAYNDGSVLAQMGNPDMRTPIAHAMAWPERVESGVAPLDLFAVGELTFERPDMERFPCLRLARDACRAGGTATTVLNAANEVAVDAFLDERLPFLAIAEVIEESLTEVAQRPASDLEAIYAADKLAREHASRYINQQYGGH
ncbi:MAG TPA: 1-deoxy-D-xylulose-5-phosphate reductoisomerase [Gammaproteobacteria bacterium]|nr:1-deoxy-D-xylulose-5-phosphate reductoisomerase [Gammaproteobacteria bacterium]